MRNWMISISLVYKFIVVIWSLCFVCLFVFCVFSYC